MRILFLPILIVLFATTLSAGDDSESTTQNQWSKHKAYAPRVDEKLRKRAEAKGVGDATIAALDWLVRHQSDDGHWSAHDHTEHCEGGRCKNSSSRHEERPGRPACDTGVTALALMAFVGRGNTHLEAEKEEYRVAIEKAAKWLISQQLSDKPPRNGRVGPDPPAVPKDHRFNGKRWHVMGEAPPYNHATATIALGELLLGSGDRALLAEPVQRAVEYSLGAQARGYAWRYRPSGGNNDTSVSCWMMASVFTGWSCAKAGLIDIDSARFQKSWDGMVAWLTRVTSFAGVIGYMAPGDPGSQLTIYETPFPYKKLRPNIAAGLFIMKLGGMERMTLERERFVPAKKKGQKGKTKKEKERLTSKDWAKLVLEHLPEWEEPNGSGYHSTINFYHWYYGAHSLFQVGGSSWTKFSKALHRVLKENQRENGCAAGSWDPIGEWGAAGGRVYTTAMGALALEAGYRYRKGKLD